MNPLTQNDEKLLCGRTDVVREIVANCGARRLTVVTAEPGLGVTSLLRAGVLPALRREGFIVAVFADWQGRDFAAALRECIANSVREDVDPLFFSQGEPLDRLLEQVCVRTGKQVTVLLDQFEDYLRCQQNSMQAQDFDAELGGAIAARKAAFVIGMQAHAIRMFQRLGQHVPDPLEFQIGLQPLTRDQAREAVLAEARFVDIEVEPAAVDALITAPVAVIDNGIHPFFLKVATGVLIEAEARLKSPVLRKATIEAQGGVDRVVLESLDVRLAELGSTQLELLFRWCAVLISPEKHRLAAAEQKLIEYAGKLNRFVPPLLEALAGLGVLRTVETQGVVRYEISRDCCALILRDWWERREAAIVARRRAHFRVTSVSVALSAILLMYVVWLIFGKSG